MASPAVGLAEGSRWWCSEKPRNQVRFFLEGVVDGGGGADRGCREATIDEFLLWQVKHLTLVATT